MCNTPRPPFEICGSLAYFDGLSLTGVFVVGVCTLPLFLQRHVSTLEWWRDLSFAYTSSSLVYIATNKTCMFLMRPHKF